MKVTLSRFSTGVLYTLTDSLIRMALKNPNSPLQGHPLVTQMQAAFAAYEVVYEKPRTSGKGNEVRAADQWRTTLFRNLKAYLNARSRMDLLPNQAEAKQLSSLLKIYGKGLARQPYVAKSAQFVSLLDALETPTSLALAAPLQLTTTVAALHTAHDDFANIYGAQATDNAQLRLQSTATRERIGLEKSVSAFLKLLTVMKDVAGWKVYYRRAAQHLQSARQSHRPRKAS